jgi:hypothetical protein
MGAITSKFKPIPGSERMILEGCWQFLGIKTIHGYALMLCLEIYRITKESLIKSLERKHLTP